MERLEANPLSKETGFLRLNVTILQVDKKRKSETKIGTKAITMSFFIFHMFSLFILSFKFKSNVSDQKWPWIRNQPKVKQKKLEIKGSFDLSRAIFVVQKR